MDQFFKGRPDRLRVESDEFRDQFRKGLRESANWDLGGARKRADDLRRRCSEIADQQDRLLNLRLLEEIDGSTYAEKATELRDEEQHLTLEIERLTQRRYEIADTAVKAFELSQSLRGKWFEADYAAKRRILESSV